MQLTSKGVWRAAAYAAVVVLGTYAVVAQQPQDDPLLRGFQNPPASAKPRVWWHWMNGNITKEGISADLEWMKRVRHRRVQNFDASLMTPPIVPKRLVFMTPEWKEAFGHAVATADRLGLEFANRRISGLERERRPVGAARAGHEEAGLDGDSRRGRQTLQRRAPEAALGGRPVPERAQGGWIQFALQAAGLLPGRRGGRLRDAGR